MLLDIFITLFLVFLNGFFVAAEFAIVKVRASQIQVRKSRTVPLALSVVNHLDAYLAATQLGITLASLGLGWVGESVVARIIIEVMHNAGVNLSEAAAHSVALPIAFMLITVLHIVFGELAPKSLAIRYPAHTTLWVAVPLKLFYLIFSPFIWVLNGIANTLLNMIGIKPIHGSEIYSEEELRLIVAESEEGGGIRPSERSLIQNVFDFDDRVVRNVMIPRSKVAAVDLNQPIEKIIESIVQEGYTRIPVYRDSLDQVIGMIYTKDLLPYLNQAQKPEILQIIRPFYVISIHKRLIDLLRDFQSRKIHFAIVQDDLQQTAGIVTLEDILEELVGEIQDESDQERPILNQTEEGEYLISARNAITDINKFLTVPLPDDQGFTTLSKMLTQIHPEALKEGDILPFGEYTCQIVRIVNDIPEIVKLTRQKENKAADSH
ncbi:MAG: HlyC/CorC family transporter [Microscillaceae bacterium]|nr:HlyC/CorC family transporter [Microscillaceae bacterium]